MNDVVKASATQIREEANHIEEVIDEYVYHVEQQQNHQSGFIMDSFRNAGHFTMS